MIYLFVFNYFCFRVHYLLTSASQANDNRTELKQFSICNLHGIPSLLGEGSPPHSGEANRLYSVV